MDVRDARFEDADEACRVLRRSITELCEADHHGDPTLLAAWLSNKTPDIVAGWIRRVDASYLVAIGRGAIAAVGGRDRRRRNPAQLCFSRRQVSRRERSAACRDGSPRLRT